MCSASTDETGRSTWCGIGWTGQPNVIPRPNEKLELRFGAFDRRYHFLDAATGRTVRPSLLTGDLAKGSATSDPDGFRPRITDRTMNGASKWAMWAAPCTTLSVSPGPSSGAPSSTPAVVAEALEVCTALQ